MPDIKLSGASSRKTSQWRSAQIELYKLKTKLLNVNRMQQFGSAFFNQFKNILITYIAAKEVINGSNGMTLGALIAISFIVGQMNAPIEKLLDFIRSWQDAKLSMLRLNEVHEMKDEENQESNNSFTFKDAIKFENISFSYSGDLRFAALKDINLSIPYGKTTAIVGASGSGKSTLVKLLLKFYEPLHGDIKIDNGYLSSINAAAWRNGLGVVLQDGVLFSDTIASNIVATSEIYEEEKMNQVLRQTNLLSYISNLPSGIQTMVGQNGEGLSAGQKQRILLARAIYKDPGLLILDEATSALDAVNEKEIVNQLVKVTSNKTVIVIAHRQLKIYRNRSIVRRIREINLS
jgi:ATP-binding cassette subfamily B protein